MEQIFTDDNCVTYRLQCRCLDPEDARDITVEFDDCGTGLMLGSTYVRHGWRNWRERIRDAWAILRGGKSYMDGFVFREEDLREVAGLFLKAAGEWEVWRNRERDKCPVCKGAHVIGVPGQCGKG